MKDELINELNDRDVNIKISTHILDGCSILDRVNFEPCYELTTDFANRIPNGKLRLIIQGRSLLFEILHMKSMSMTKSPYSDTNDYSITSDKKLSGHITYTYIVKPKF